MKPYITTAAAFAAAEAVKTAVTPFVYKALLPKGAEEFARFEHIGAVVGIAAFAAIFMLIILFLKEEKAVLIAPVLAFLAEYSISASGLIIYGAKETKGFQSGFILLLIAVVSMMVYLIPLAVSNLTFFTIYAMTRRKKDE